MSIIIEMYVGTDSSGAGDYVYSHRNICGT